VVWTRYCGTAAKAGGKRRKQTSSCSYGSLLPTRKKTQPLELGKNQRGMGRETLAPVDTFPPLVLSCRLRVFRPAQPGLRGIPICVYLRPV
jgi:hypothetical protein